MDAQLAWLLVAEVALIVVLAVLSVSETALHAVRRRHAREELFERPGGRVVRRISESWLLYLSAIQVLEFLVVFAYSAIAAAFVAPRLEQVIGPPGLAADLGDVTAVVVTVVLLTLVALLLGLFVPRAIGARYPAGALLALAVPIEAARWVTSPVVGLLWLLTTALTRPFGLSAQTTPDVSEDEIRALVETGEEQGVLEEQERDMIRGVFALGDKQVHEVMVPRTDVRALDAATPGDHVLEEVVAIGHSRIPVYEGTPDNIIGILFVKDLFRRLARGEKNVSVRELLRPAHFVPETKRVDDLLGEMQRTKRHMTIVVDEYGGTAGVVTIEDLVEEIVGEIRDEYDVEQELITPVSESEALMDGRVPFDDVRETFDLALPSSEDYDTLGGYIVHELGRLPRAGEEVRTDGVRFVVESLEGRRVRRVRVTRDAGTPREQAVGS